MPNNETENLLKEQKKRQLELIELKKLKNAGGALPNNIEHEVLDTPSSKLKHFWYYYKYYVISFVIIIAVFAVLVAQCASKTEYDYTVLFNATEYVIDADLDLIKQEIESVADDRNGDGEVKVLIINCSRPSNYTNPQFNNTQVTKFQTQLIENQAKIFITDEATFDQFTADDLHLWTDHFSLPDKNGAALDLERTTLSKHLESYEMKFFISYRESESYDTSDAKFFRKVLEIIEKQ